MRRDFTSAPCGMASGQRHFVETIAAYAVSAGKREESAAICRLCPRATRGRRRHAALWHLSFTGLGATLETAGLGATFATAHTHRKDAKDSLTLALEDPFFIASRV